MSSPIKRLTIPPAAWPTDDLFRWNRALAGNGYKGADNRAVSWSRRRCENVEDAYGRFLGWLKQHKGSLSSKSCVDAVTPKNIECYIAYLRETLAPHSVLTYFEGVTSFVAVTTPKIDVDWMNARYAKMKARAYSTRPKTAHIQHTATLVKLGIALMNEASAGDPLKGPPDIETALKFQAGLMIVVLAIAPLRIRNFQDIVIGRSLVYEHKRYLLRFSAAETKTGMKIEIPLPAELEPYIKIFCAKYRPALMKQAGKLNSLAFWIDQSGKKMREEAIRGTIKHWTQLKFGKHVWPHLFRDAAATTIAQDDPEHIAIVASVLSHTSLRTAKKSYDQSTSLQASRSAAEILFVLQTADVGLDEAEATPW